VRQIENHPTGPNDLPTERVEIADCGELQPDDPSLAESTVSADGDIYEDYPDDDDRNVQNPETALDIAKKIREIANKLFREGQVEAALEKYQSESGCVKLGGGYHQLDCFPRIHPVSRRASVSARRISS
jgi:peptidyl-prolyl isomerase D